jgi:hypothetical protein
MFSLLGVLLGVTCLGDDLGLNLTTLPGANKNGRSTFAAKSPV